MNTISLAAAAATGARHLRVARNGQDASAVWRDIGSGDDSDPGPIGIVVVADGCGSAPSSEVGARLGSALFARMLGARLARGASVLDAATWAGARGDLVAALADLLERAPGDRAELVHECLLFTLVAAAVTPEGAAVWALGDGVYAFGENATEAVMEPHVLGPFADNQPPYLAYDLLGEPRAAHFQIGPAACDAVIVATDGACDLLERGESLARFTTPKLLAHPDGLRRELALLARGEERIDWDAGRVVRTPAALQDDCAIGVLRWTRRWPS